MAKASKAVSGAADGQANENTTVINPATAPRKIPGNLPYLTSSGTLKKVLDKIIEASRPDKFNADFLENVLKLPGGSPRATIPILKRMGFLTSEGVPTELYARFRTDSGRGPAALQGIRTGFPEIFKRSEYAHSVDDGKLKDIIVEITGLKPNESVAAAIRGTFNAVKSYIPKGADVQSFDEEKSSEDNYSTQANGSQIFGGVRDSNQSNMGLVYNINIVLQKPLI